MHQRHLDYRERLAKIKLDAGCVDCGYSQWPEALDFDHRPGEIKLFNVGGGLLRWDKMEAEMAKCDIVCANCHRHRTWLRGQELGWDHNRVVKMRHRLVSA